MSRETGPSAMMQVACEEIRQGSSLRTEEVGCGVCGHNERRPLFEETYALDEEQVRLRINRCRDCGQVYVSPRLDPKSTARVYARDTERTISHNYCWAGQTSDARFDPLIERLARRQPHGNLLDVGCGNGSFLAAAARQNHWQLTGVDPHAPSTLPGDLPCDVRILRATLESAAFPAEYFDIVTLLGVLEHLHDPLATLRAVRRVLRPGGIVAVYVPNYHYLRWKDAGPACWLRTGRWSRLAPQEHLFHFTARSLPHLLQRAGFFAPQLDVGRPFLTGHGVGRYVKQSAFVALRTLFAWTGIHLAGIEAIALRRPE